MKKEKSFNIKSELLNDNLETIYPVYLNFKELVTDYNLNLDTDDEFDIQILFESLYLNALYYWEEIYPKFVLDPIKKEITEVAQGKVSRVDNLLKNAPHCHEYLLQAEWSHPYTRAEAAYPLAWVKKKKYWPPVARVDEAYGDRNFCCH